jgi:hypothetical protein
MSEHLCRQDEGHIASRKQADAAQNQVCAAEGHLELDITPLGSTELHWGCSRCGKGGTRPRRGMAPFSAAGDRMADLVADFMRRHLPDMPELLPWQMDILRREFAAYEQMQPCCDMHNRHCEPPSELCCWQCTEADHPRHPQGVVCTWTQAGTDAA